MAGPIIKDQILYFGNIVSLKLYGNESYFLLGDGYGTDKIIFQDLDQHQSCLFSQTLFLIVPVFNNDNKKLISKFHETLAGYNWTQKKFLTQELLENLMAEVETNIEVSESNYTTPIKYNLSTFQLYHITSNRYLYLCPPDKASTASRLGLVDTPSTSTCWKFRNCLKYQIEGECLITYGSPLQLVSTFDFSGSYPALSCNSNSQKSVLEPMCTLEGETELTVALWKSEVQQLESKYLCGGDMIMIVQLDHSLLLSVKYDIEQQVSSFIDSTTARAVEHQLILENLPGSTSQEKITFTNSIWIVEHLEKDRGDPITWNDKVRLLNLAAQKYLCIYNTLGEEGDHFYLDHLREDSADCSVFHFISTNNSPKESFILNNDYLSIRCDGAKSFVGIRLGEQGGPYTLAPSVQHYDENTFKLMKSDRASNEISFFQISAFRTLSEFLQELKLFKNRKAYKEAQRLHARVFPSIRLIMKLRAFVRNKYLISNISDKYARINPGRQIFLAQQQYLLFCSLTLSNLFDRNELDLLNLTPEGHPGLENLPNVLNHKVELKNLESGVNMKRRASSTVTSDDLMAQFIELLKAKVYLANEIYGLLEDICQDQPKHQQVAYECAVYYMNQFAYLPRCSEFLSHLVAHNRENAESLRRNFNYERIQFCLPSSDRMVFDLLIKDPQMQLADDFATIRAGLLIPEVSTDIRTRMINPIVYCAMLLCTTKNSQVALKSIQMLRKICLLDNRPNPHSQDMVYKLILVIPEFKLKLLELFHVEDGQFILKVDSDPKKNISFKEAYKYVFDLPRLKDSSNQHADACELFIETLKLFSLLVAGRNISWRETLKETFSAKFLAAQISLKSDEMLQINGTLFKLFLDIHVDVYPLERLTIPSMIRFVGEISSAYSLGESYRRIRTLIQENQTYSQDLPASLAKQLSEEFWAEVERFTKSELMAITNQIQKCKTKEEIRIDDLPANILDCLKFILEMMSLSVFGVMNLENMYQPILSACFKIFNYSVRLPENFALLMESQKEIVPAATSRLRLSFSIARPVKQKLKVSKNSKIPGTMLSEQFEKKSLIQGNYFSLKNEVFNTLEVADIRPTRRDLEAKHIILKILSKLLDSRQQFLIDNYTEWVRHISQTLSATEYTIQLEAEAFSLCEREVEKVIPPPMPTGLQKIDTSLLKNSTFKKFVDPSHPELYDLPHLILSPPGTENQSSLRYEAVLPSVLVAVINSEDEATNNQLIGLFFRLFSQRREFFSNIKKSVLIHKNQEKELYEKFQVHKERLFEIEEFIQTWHRLEPLDADVLALETQMEQLLELLRTTLVGARQKYSSLLTSEQYRERKRSSSIVSYI